MYAPAHNRAGREEALRFMQAHPFATLVTGGSGLLATHLLFQFEGDPGRGVLASHMARANPQWKRFGDDEALVVFQGPHAYISPVHYEKKQNVPTWNYVAVHAYGRVTVLDDEADKLALLHRLVRANDPSYYEQQFKDLPEAFIHAKLKGIVAFRLRIDRIEERFKLSQDKTDREKQNIVGSLSASGDPYARGIADAMQKAGPGENR